MAKRALTECRSGFQKKPRNREANSFLVYGPMAERLGKGLQNLLQRFNSASDLKIEYARVVELVDTRDLKSLDRKVMLVRFRPRALHAFLPAAPPFVAHRRSIVGPFYKIAVRR